MIGEIYTNAYGHKVHETEHGIACIRMRRKYICIEKEPKYFEIGVKRIETELAQMEIEL